MKKRCKSDDDEDEEDFNDFEDSGDDYHPLEPSEGESASSSSEDESNVVKVEAKPVPRTPSSRRTRFSTRQQQDLVFESDKYFGHTNRKV